MNRQLCVSNIFLLIVLSLSTVKISADELIDTSTFTDSNSSASLDSLSFLQERISAQFITKYLQDSNIFLRKNETEANILNGSVLLGIKGGGLPSDPGISYKALYGGNYFSSLTDEFEYDSPADHNFFSGVELRGGFTRIGLNASIQEYGGYARSEPFGDGISSSIGEARNLGYKRKALALNVSRELSSSILEIGFSLDDYEYNFIEIFSGSTVVYDRDRFATDIAWWVEPTFLGKTRLGLGVTAGQEEVPQNFLGAQNFLTPSLRAKWNFSPKTAVAGWFGFDERWRDSDEFSETTPVYGLKGFWTAPTETELSVDITKQVYPSIFEIDDNVATKKFSVGARQNFNRGLSLDFRFFYEFSGYQPTKVGNLRSRTEDLKSFRLSLGKEMNIDYFKDSQLSLFYNYLTNDSTKEFYDYERDQFGLQFKFSL